MKSIEIFNRLTKEQRDLLDDATGSKIIEKTDISKVKDKLNEFSRGGKYGEWNNFIVFSENYIERGWWSLSDKTQKNFDEVLRYLNSLEDSEEVRKEKVIGIADREHEKNQKELNERMILGDGLTYEIIDDLIKIQHDLTTKLGIEFGFTYEEISEIVKREFDFYPDKKNVHIDECRKILEELFG